MRKRFAALPALVLASALTLTACGGDSSDSVSVSGDFGSVPNVDIGDNTSVDSTTTDTVIEGDGPEIADNTNALVNLVLFNGSTGDQIFSTYATNQPMLMRASASSDQLPGLAEALIGAKTGSRLVVTMTPDDAFGSAGNSQLNVSGDDDVVAVADVMPKPTIPKANGDLGDITINDNDGKQPTISFKKPLHIGSSTSKVVREGDGAVTKTGDSINVKVVGYDLTTGKALTGVNWQAGEQAIQLQTGSSYPPIIKALTGIKLGSRVAVTLTPQDYAWPVGDTSQNVGATDSVLWIIDTVKPPAPSSIGDISVKQPTKAGAPPTLTFKTPFTVTKSAYRTISEGSGPAIKEGDKVVVNYLGELGSTGKAFDSSYQRKQTQTFTVAQGQLISGFYNGLVGVKEGSKVLMAIPPSDGYGSQGQSQAGIGPNETLVFYVSVLKVESGSDSQSGDSGSQSGDSGDQSGDSGDQSGDGASDGSSSDSGQ